MLSSFFKRVTSFPWRIPCSKVGFHVTASSTAGLFVQELKAVAAWLQLPWPLAAASNEIQPHRIVVHSWFPCPSQGCHLGASWRSRPCESWSRKPVYQLQGVVAALFSHTHQAPLYANDWNEIANIVHELPKTMHLWRQMPRPSFSGPQAPEALCLQLWNLGLLLDQQLVRIDMQLFWWLRVQHLMFTTGQLGDLDVLQLSRFPHLGHKVQKSMRRFQLVLKQNAW